MMIDTSLASQADPAEAHPKGQPLSCIVVEDQAMFLELLTGLLSARPGLSVVAQARSVALALEACRHWAPDLLLLDLALPDGDGLDVARAFLESRPDGRIIVLSGHAANFVCPAWLNDRVQAVVSKNSAFEVLSRELDDLLGMASVADEPAKPHSRLLSEREAKVFALIGEGLSSAEIGARLGVSSHTVQTHRKRIAAKLGTTGRELVHRAVAYRLSLSSPE